MASENFDEKNRIVFTTLNRIAGPREKRLNEARTIENGNHCGDRQISDTAAAASPSPRPPREQMRPHSPKSQISISPPTRTTVHPTRRILTAMLLIMATLAWGTTTWAGVEIVQDKGRRIQTGPKGPQIVIDGITLHPDPATQAWSGYESTERGRMRHARPTQSVSVGLLGCPGCTWTLEALGGIFPDVDEGGRFTERRNRPDRRRGEPKKRMIGK